MSDRIPLSHYRHGRRHQGYHVLPTRDDDHQQLQLQQLNEQAEQKQLLQDPVFHNALKTARDLQQRITEWKPRRDTTLKLLREIKDLLEKSYQKRTIAKVSGASAAIAGSTLAIVGFGLSFFTFGASLSLTVAGGILAASGGVTMGGADLGDWIVSRSHMKVVEKAIEQDRESSSELREIAEKFSNQISELNIKYPSLKKETILTAISNLMKGGQAAKIIYDGYKLVDSGFDIIRSIFKVGRFAGTGAGAARVAWTGINTLAGGLSIAGVIFDAVALPFDVIVLIKGSYDIHKYNSGKGSNCNKANQVGEMIKKLEEHKQQMLLIQDMFNEEKNTA